METVAEFVAATHTRTRGQKMPDVSIGIASAKAIRERLDPNRMAQIAEAARQYLPQVQAEIADLHAALDDHPVTMTRRALLFGVATPNRSEDQSIAWAVAAEPYYGTLSAEDLARVTYDSPTGNGNQCVMGLQMALERSIADMAALFGPSPWRWEITRDALRNVRGVGPKVASMIYAVLYPGAQVWTVDLWHGRQLLWAAHLPYAAKVSIDAGAYDICESMWLDYANHYFPGIETWAVQWATWCAAEGRFVSHKALWEDLAG